MQSRIRRAHLSSRPGPAPEVIGAKRSIWLRLGWARLIEALLLFAAAGFFALHFVHLSADFPNHSPWMDWSKYTDEGWYGDAAIRQIRRGHWYMRGDFNPGVTLPVWPGLEFLLFSITGVSVVAARALSVSVFCGILIAAYLLAKRHSRTSGSFDLGGISFAPVCAVALLVVSPFFYAFTRLAILEPLLILLTLLALLTASRAKTGRVLPVLGLGILLPLMILTKTTAVFLLPSIAWMLWARAEYRMVALLRTGIPVAAIAGGLWSAYFFVLVRPHYLEDYRYLFSANAYTGMTRENAWSVIRTRSATACGWAGLSILGTGFGAGGADFFQAMLPQSAGAVADALGGRICDLPGLSQQPAAKILPGCGVAVDAVGALGLARGASWAGVCGTRGPGGDDCGWRCGDRCDGCG